ncbi:MAG: hypothetical protein ACTSYI_14520 [Promethearchaeota archaeon]
MTLVGNQIFATTTLTTATCEPNLIPIELGMMTKELQNFGFNPQSALNPELESNPQSQSIVLTNSDPIIISNATEGNDDRFQIPGYPVSMFGFLFVGGLVVIIQRRRWNISDL